jgi:hypothetical protein
VDCRGLRRFQRQSRRKRHTDAQQQHRRVRLFRYQPQRDTAAGALAGVTYPWGAPASPWTVAGFVQW